MSNNRVANRFLLQGIQHWGQSDAEREKATRDYIEAAGLESGTEEANKWLANVLTNLRRGKFELEIEQLNTALEARQRGPKP
jgi:hypothetical protein